MKIKNYKIITKDNHTLDTVSYTPNISNGKIIIMCHGLTGVKQGRVSDDTYLNTLAERLCDKGFKVVQFDWRGHGLSSGKDIDVNCDSFFNDLDSIIKNEKGNLELNLWGWSIGGFSIIQYLLKTNIKVEKVVLWSPVLEPIASFFYNKNSVACYQSIIDSTKDGSLYRNGYALWAAKNFKITETFLNQSRNFDFVRAINCLPQETLIILGDNDVLVDASYAENYAKEFNFNYKILNAGHALYEDIETAIKLSVDYFCK